MKTTIYELLGMIKDGKAPKKIKYKDKIYYYFLMDNDYYSLDSGEWLFDENIVTSIINDEVVILETTITLEGVQRCSELNNKIEKIDMYDGYTSHNNLHFYINTYDKDDKIKRFVISAPQREIILKINEIIDKVNKL